MKVGVKTSLCKVLNLVARARDPEAVFSNVNCNLDIEADGLPAAMGSGNGFRHGCFKEMSFI
jgi:hypothetical protein